MSIYYCIIKYQVNLNSRILIILECLKYLKDETELHKKKRDRIISYSSSNSEPDKKNKEENMYYTIVKCRLE